MYNSEYYICFENQVKYLSYCGNVSLLIYSFIFNTMLFSFRANRYGDLFLYCSLRVVKIDFAITVDID